MPPVPHCWNITIAQLLDVNYGLSQLQSRSAIFANPQNEIASHPTQNCYISFTTCPHGSCGTAEARFYRQPSADARGQDHRFCGDKRGRLRWSIPPADLGQLRDTDGNAEREDWPREKLLVRLFLSLFLGINFVEAVVLIRLSNTIQRNTLKTIPSPSSATAHKVTAKVWIYETMA